MAARRAPGSVASRSVLHKSMLRQSLLLTQDQIEDMRKVFESIDNDGNGTIDLKELGRALEVCGIKIPGYELRDMVASCDTGDRDDAIDIEEFKDMYTQLKVKYDFKGQMQKLISPVDKKEEVVVKKKDDDFIKHTVRVEEQIAFTNWMTMSFKDDQDCVSYFPFKDDGSDLYKKCQDGILYLKLINLSQPGTVHEQAINKPTSRQQELSVFQCHENLTLAIRSAQSIGCSVVNIGPDDLYEGEGREHIVLGLVWQVIRIGLLSAINLVQHKELVCLLEDGETMEELMQLSPEQILIRWVNYHLRQSGCGRVVTNFSADIRDSVAYVHLLHQIAPPDAGVDTSPLTTEDLTSRAELMLREADKMKCRVFLSPSQVVKGNYNLNLAFVAYLFNRYPALSLPTETVEIVDETREEKTYRNWMNSLAVSPRVNHLYTDLIDGLIIFQLYDVIQPGIVQWKRVVRQFNTRRIVMEMIGNCNYAVELGREKCKFSLVGMDGSNIYEGNKTYILALLWQLMRAYTLSLLNKIKQLDQSSDNKIDKEIIAWANNKLKSGGKQVQISGFNDRKISDARPIIDLIDSIQPSSINYQIIKSTGSEQDKLDNAKYAISVARKLGARIYALAEDIVEVKSKMLMTIFACLMILDLERHSS
jgi:plastin-3